MLYLTCAACLDRSRREDFQARTVKGRLSWTGRRYQAGTRQAHGLQWTRPCCSMLFENTFDRGFYIPRNHKIIISKCWIRLLRRIGDGWVVEDGYDRWNTTLRPLFLNLWDLIVKSSVVDNLDPTSFYDDLEQGTCINNFVGFFNDSVAKPIFPCLPEVELVSSDASSVYRSPSPQSPSSSSNHLDFHISSPTDEEVFATTAVDSTPIVAPFCLPPAVSDSFNDLWASMSCIITNQSKESRRLDDSHNEVLDKIKQLEKTILDAFYQQNQVFHRLITGIRQEANNDTTALSLGLKAVRTQTAILSTDQADARKEAKEQKAIIVDMDERLATLRSEQLDFRAQAQENYNNLSSQLGELVAYINRGNDKKGEDSSSRLPMI
ncbi:U-box domain-containing protein 43 [Dorcoceras hygrometricum]|uniref:U-box domain-containing protein 43 n=1 Tax=Dorcoceras hygrometricum TaxID=472368 RepID=A0A2Z7CAZ4_9LAMI|nr:U-box domain-containing protein 43 [Dorcoceras hygrometricum]